MKKRIRQLTAAFAAMTMIIGTMPSMAFADGPYNNTVSQTGAHQNLTNINSDSIETPDGKAVLTKSLVIDEDSNIPKAEFTYEIVSPATTATGDAARYVSKSADNGTTVSVLRGINANKITVSGWDADGDTTTHKGAAATVAANLAMALNDDTTPVAAVANVDTDAYNDKPVITLKYNKQQVVRAAAATPDTSKYVITEATAEDDDVYIVDYKQEETTRNSSYYTANKTMLLDFTQCGFTEPGIYRYLITEGGTNAGITNDATAVRTLDVYVEHKDAATSYQGGTAINNDLVIAGYVLYNGDLAAAVPQSATITAGDTVTLVDGSTTANKDGNVSGTGVKSSGWQNVYDTANITIGKKVDGNQGSKDKYFEFTVVVETPTANDDFRIEVSNIDGETNKTVVASGNLASTATPNEATKYSWADIYTAGEAIASGTDPQSGNNAAYFDVTGSGTAVGTHTYKVYLQNGQFVTLKGLPVGTKYTISEDFEDYKATAYADDDASHDGSKWDLAGLKDYVKAANNTTAPTGVTVPTLTVSGTKAELAKATLQPKTTGGTLDDYEYAFLNEKKGVLPTGIIMSVAPAVIVGIGVLAAIFALVLGGKKKELDEE